MGNGLPYYLKKYNEITERKGKPQEGFFSINIKVAILRTYSCEILEKILTVDAYERDVKAEIFVGGYGQINQEILDEKSALYAFNPDIVLLLINLEDFAPWLITSAINLKKILKEDIRSIIDDITALIERLANENKKVFITNFVKPVNAPDSSFEAQNQWGINQAVRQLNTLLTEAVSDFDSAYIIDAEDIIFRIGANNAYDKKMRLIAKNPYTIDVYKEFSHKLLNAVLAVFGKRKKCIILDLDNTLWKGIIGEEGTIEINDSFKDMQRQLMYLNNSGILLGINSKNNEDDVNLAFSYSDMILNRDNFSVTRINWNDKVTNLREIAKELNIGLDSIIFIDDSEFECEFVQAYLPDAAVVRLDGNYLRYSDIIKNLDGTDFIYLTDEDINKKNQFTAQKMRIQLKSSSKSLDEYLESLHIAVRIKEADESSLSRVSQLTQKTNQFNLTTRRYTTDQLKDMQGRSYKIYTVNDSDKFGDNGITGVMIIDTAGQWLIDTFLLSCRVMNRGIEKAFMFYVINEAKKRGVKEISGEYIETKKNAPVKNLYADYGFVFVDGLFVFDLGSEFECPPFIKIIEGYAAQ